MGFRDSSRLAATALLAGLSILLTGCFITPGKFTSELILSKDDQFTFTYDGEIFFLGLSNLAETNAAAQEFVAETCYNDETYEERECSEDEIEEQRASWEADAETRAAEAAMMAQQISTMIGGVNPSDPEATRKLADVLLRQKGWERVEDKGNGIFDVRYSVTGNLTHDFMFPTIEGVPPTNPFVQIILRNDRVVRINATGFATQDGTNPMMAIAGLAGPSTFGFHDSGMAKLPEIEGTFKIVTDGAIRANNTDEGPVAIGSGQELVWDITVGTSTPPTALIDLSR